MNKPRNKQEQRYRQAGTVRKVLHNEMSNTRDEKAYKEFKAPPYMIRKRNDDVIVNSMQEVDFSELLIPMIAVYDNPKDYPGSYVARVYDIDIPTNVVMVKSALQEIEEDIKTHIGKEFFRRGKEDDETLVGVWM